MNAKIFLTLLLIFAVVNGMPTERWIVNCLRYCESEEQAIVFEQEYNDEYVNTFTRSERYPDFVVVTSETCVCTGKNP